MSIIEPTQILEMSDPSWTLGGATLIDGIINKGKAAVTDGINDRIDANPANFGFPVDGETNKTFGAWIKTDAQPSSGGSFFVAQAGTTFASSLFSLNVGGGFATTLILFVQGPTGVAGNNTYRMDISEINDDQWHFWFLVMQNTDVKAYRDAKLVPGTLAQTNLGYTGPNATHTNQFTVGTFAGASGAFTPLAIERPALWEGTALTQENMDAYFEREKLLNNPTSFDHIQKIIDWGTEDPSLADIGTLTEPFDLGAILAVARFGGQVITERQQQLLNKWADEDPGLARVSTLTNPFKLGDVIAELVGDPPFATTLTQTQIELLNEWSSSDSSLSKVGTLTDPFMLGDILDELLSR